jgi:hypothetical protein
MRKVPIGELVSLSISRTNLILFKPFSLKKWLCLLFIAYLAGSLTNCSLNGPANQSRSQKKPKAIQSHQVTEQANINVSNGQFKTKDTLFRYDNKKIRPGLFFALPIILIAIFLVVPLMILFTWLVSRFKFIWYEAIVKNDASILEPFKGYKKEGNSLFRFYLVLLLGVIVFLGFMALLVYTIGNASGFFSSQNEISFFAALSAFLLPGLIFIAGVILLSFLHIAVDHFVVTIMALEREGFKTAWGKFLKLYKANQKEFLFYLLVLTGLGIVCGIMIICLIILCIIAVIFLAAIAFGLPYLIFAVALKSMPLFVVAAVIIGLPFAVGFFLLMSGIFLPFAVFFRSFSLYFLSSIECEYEPLSLV